MKGSASDFRWEGSKVTAILPADLYYTAMSLDRHNPQAVAQLIHASAPEMFMLLLGRTATQTLEQLVKLSHNRFSHRHIRVAESDGQVFGMATLVPAAELNAETDYQQVFHGWGRLRWNLAHRFILDRVLEQTYPVDSIYVGNLAVHPAYRGNGIGSQLLRHCIHEAQSSKVHQVFISVDIHNPRAQKLYESLGFQVVTTQTMSLPGMTIGSRVLTRSLHYH
jgi:ribosomal protein S18 acetylase RimI-like enzyme